jgi:hypothetical protein
MKYVAFTLALVALAQSAAYVARMPPPPDDGIGAVLAAYESVAPMLPAEGVIGFVNTAANDDLNTLNFYLAQHALAPRLLSREPDAATDFAVTATGAPPDVGKTPALARFRLIGTGAGEIRVFRRQRP